MYIYIYACLVVVVFFLLLLLEKKIRDHTPSLFILFVQLYRILYEYFSDCPASCLGLHSIDRSHYHCCCYEEATAVRTMLGCYDLRESMLALLILCTLAEYLIPYYYHGSASSCECIISLNQDNGFF